MTIMGEMVASRRFVSSEATLRGSAVPSELSWSMSTWERTVWLGATFSMQMHEEEGLTGSGNARDKCGHGG